MELKSKGRTSFVTLSNNDATTKNQSRVAILPSATASAACNLQPIGQGRDSEFKRTIPGISHQTVSLIFDTDKLRVQVQIPLTTKVVKQVTVATKVLNP